MNLKVLLADAAVPSADGKLNALGLGWSSTFSPLPQHAIAIWVAAEWTETNTPHEFTLDLLDADGNPVTIEGETVIHIEGSFEVGRPPGSLHGAPIMHTQAFTVPAGMPLQMNQRYLYKVRVGAATSTAAFAVVPPTF